MVYKKDFTTTYTINGHEYSITSPALFDSNTNELIPNNELDDMLKRLVSYIAKIWI